ncbi:type IV pili methyl-accepting chemotaxis transducer N-terminal domain-containing protein [Cyanobacteria bacterium FACHB-472]|nr:type IV pili methyl-accepting chemotaxis transducer N-terminal domain-containing protein [Cyanobacteria bacterium FACHB-472]
MTKKPYNGIYRQTLFILGKLSVPVLTTYLHLDEINTVREINAAVVNVSGRQRMLSQRTALFALRLVCTKDKQAQEELRSGLLADLDLMERSHKGLIKGDRDLKLPGHPSPTVQSMYFEAPLYLDRQVRQYIDQARAIAQSSCEELIPDNPHLCYILTESSKNLVEALDAVVNQYQKESDTEQLAIHIYQAQLYEKSCAATAQALSQAKKLEQALQELQQAQSQLVEKEKMSNLGCLVAGVAHEINNPVSFIYGNLNYATDYIQNLLDLVKVYEEEYPKPSVALQEKIDEIDLEFLKEDLPKVMYSMEVGAKRIHQIVRSLRNFSRTDEELIQVVDIHEGIDNTLLILQNRLKAHGDNEGIEIVKEYGNLPLIECYSGQINQVLMNLIGNAIDELESLNNNVCGYSKKIKISTEVCHRGTIILRIADNGHGMNEDVKARLFEPFFTTKPVGKGTGLGLSISYQIVVEKHQGSIECISQPGEGTEFIIEIPVVQRQQEEITNELESVA